MPHQPNEASKPPKAAYDGSACGFALLATYADQAKPVSAEASCRTHLLMVRTPFSPLPYELVDL